MRKFKFKDNQSNIEKLYRYALYKFPRLRNRLEYDEWGQFVMYRKNEDTTIFYYVRATTSDLNFNVYKKQVAKIDKAIIRDFKQRVYPDEKLMIAFDRILKPLSR